MEILGRKPTSTPKDLFGNEVVKDVLVFAQLPYPVIWKVIAVEHGGISTPQGQTPAIVRIVADVTLRLPPGTPFSQLIKVCQPAQEKALESIADLLGKS